MFGLFKPKFEKFYLNVPYSKKDYAKALGAKWDPVSSTWYVTNAATRQICKKWLPAQKCFAPYETLISQESCYRCGTLSQVAALAVSGVEDGQEDLKDIPLILMHLEYLNYPFIAMLKNYNSGFSKKF